MLVVRYRGLKVERKAFSTIEFEYLLKQADGSKKENREPADMAAAEEERGTGKPVGRSFFMQKLGKTNKNVFITTGFNFKK